MVFHSLQFDSHFLTHLFHEKKIGQSEKEKQKEKGDFVRFCLKITSFFFFEILLKVRGQQQHPAGLLLCPNLKTLAGQKIWRMTIREI